MTAKPTYIRPHGATTQFEYGTMLNEHSYLMHGVTATYEGAERALEQLAIRQQAGVPNEDEIAMLMNGVGLMVGQHTSAYGYSLTPDQVEAVAERIADAIKAAHAKGEATY